MRSSLKIYSLGLVALAAAVLLRWVLDPMMGDALPLVTLFGAVAAAVWLGGYRVAIPLRCSAILLVFTFSSLRVCLSMSPELTQSD